MDRHRPRWTRVTWVCAWLGLAIGFVQCLTYLAFSERQMFATVPLFLPTGRFSHFSNFGELRFVCIAQPTWAAYPERQREWFVRVLRKHAPVVYRGSESIPPEARLYRTDPVTGNQVFCGYRRGCIASMLVRRSGLFWFQGEYSDYEGPEAASMQHATFVWILGRWICVHREIEGIA